MWSVRALINKEKMRSGEKTVREEAQRRRNMESTGKDWGRSIGSARADVLANSELLHIHVPVALFS